MSDDLYRRAASKDKKFHVVEGSNHMQVYYVPKYVDEAVSVLAPFFKSKPQSKLPREKVVAPGNGQHVHNVSAMPLQCNRGDWI